MNTSLAATEEDFYLMSNIRPKTSGLPFVVWISPRGNAKPDIRVKVAASAKANPEEMVSIGLRPNVHVIDGYFPPSDLRKLTEWIELNFVVLLQFWNNEIEYTEDVYGLLKPINS